MKNIPAACAEQEQMRDWEEVRELGRGSNGVVYHVRNSRTGEEAALKWIHIEYGGENGMSLQAFREAQTQLLDEINIMQRLSSTPEIAAIQAYTFNISADGTCMDTCIRMELLTPLVDLLREKSITVGQTAKIVTDVSNALSACHAHGIIHGDVKPENILSGGNCFKLSDFGVSLSLQRKFCRRIKGTQYFQPPEIRQSHEASVSSDVYSLGMTLYVLFNNGMLPFQRELNRQDEMAAWHKCCDLAKTPGSRYPVPRHAAAEVAQVITRATALDPAERYGSLEELRDAFVNAITGLAENQKLMQLPYFRAEEASGVHDRIYLSTNRRTLDPSKLGQNRDETDMKRTNAATLSGFEIPRTRPEDEQQPEEPEVSYAQVDEEEEKKNRKPLILLAIMVIVLIVGAVVGIPMLTGKEEMALSVEPGAFDAVVTIVHAKEEEVTATLNVSGSDEVRELAAKPDGLKLTGLAPETDYVLTVTSGKEMVEEAFRTAAAPMTVNVEPNSFGAVVTIAYAKVDVMATLRAGDSDEAVVLEAGCEGLILTGLLPETDYVLTVSSGSEKLETAFRTSVAAMDVSVEPNSFDAAVTISYAKEDVTAKLRVRGSDKDRDISADREGMLMTELAPETDYILTVFSGAEVKETPFRTGVAALERFRPIRQRIYTCAAEQLGQMTDTELLLSGQLTEPKKGTLPLRQIRLRDQNLAILLYCTVGCEPGEVAEMPLYLVLRAEDDVIVRTIGQPGQMLEDTQFWMMYDYAELFDAYFNLHGRHCAGQVRLELYWQGEMLGSADLIIE